MQQQQQEIWTESDLWCFALLCRYRPRRRSGSSIVVLGADDSLTSRYSIDDYIKSDNIDHHHSGSNEQDAQYLEMLTMLSVNQDNGKWIEWISVPDEITETCKTMRKTRWPHTIWHSIRNRNEFRRKTRSLSDACHETDSLNHLCPDRKINWHTFSFNRSTPRKGGRCARFIHRQK